MDSLEHRTLGKEGHGAEGTLVPSFAHGCTARQERVPRDCSPFPAASRPSCTETGLSGQLVFHVPGDSVGLKAVTLSPTRMLKGVASISTAMEVPPHRSNRSLLE